VSKEGGGGDDVVSRDDHLRVFPPADKGGGLEGESTERSEVV